MELSKRLKAVADLVSEGRVVADVGTDHGYIPIYLLETKKCRKAFAMDVNAGPLERAKEHITAYGLSDAIETRLSDGVTALSAGECDCVVIAGMGGALTIKIMEEGKSIFQNLKEFVLQPQSELSKVRQYLCENGYVVIAEDMVLEDGKFYPMMKVTNGRSPEYNTIELRYGKYLLEQKHPVLKEFLKKEVQVKGLIMQNLDAQSGAHIEARKAELSRELAEVKEAICFVER
ncbi:MAG: SAM-dependent methyltransferase [Tyzzerella sp.]|nr:SAM-dependent methyltransferase [Tyzzerella sp.]